MTPAPSSSFSPNLFKKNWARAAFKYSKRSPNFPHFFPSPSHQTFMSTMISLWVKVNWTTKMENDEKERSIMEWVKKEREKEGERELLPLKKGSGSLWLREPLFELRSKELIPLWSFSLTTQLVSLISLSVSPSSSPFLPSQNFWVRRRFFFPCGFEMWWWDLWVTWKKEEEEPVLSQRW